MVANARVDRAWQPYESCVLAGGIALAAALGVEPSCQASKARVIAGPAASELVLRDGFDPSSPV
jgi:hypothetical protein